MTTAEGEKATVDGMITYLLPEKGKFFDGTISDVSGEMRVVGFTETKRKKLDDLFTKKEPVRISKCVVRDAYSGDDILELVLQDGTQIGISEKTSFDGVVVPEREPAGEKQIKLKELQDQSRYKKVNVTVKVIEVAETRSLSAGTEV